MSISAVKNTEQKHLLSSIERKHQDELREIINGNSNFISILAHDLRGPFSTAISILSMLKENIDDYDTEEIKKFITKASSSADGALTLLDNLLVWIVSQQGGKLFNPIDINLQQLISVEIVNLGFLIGQKKITVNQSIPKDITLFADLNMLKAIIRNLTGNAIKFTPTGGAITINALISGPFVQVAIRDNGVGISLKGQQKLFKKGSYYSTDGTNNEKGTGLGLLICKEYVKLHHGDIWVKSRIGKGTEFIFTLKLHQE
ncbi:sensor histidine kinase [Fulvivirga ligni]|uniref:sensor histidine kinase n=1 Tax=Fulvivirga ligni TaxID=2904246 RepID=UPI001F20878A|nr:HAMP domain-containing sensor histidine kinase [Fulvivirga ligni]UII21167.1 HAMP domain-containing histidine kinase [Fulvivirga ligni]